MSGFHFSQSSFNTISLPLLRYNFTFNNSAFHYCTGPSHDSFLNAVEHENMDKYRDFSLHSETLHCLDEQIYKSSCISHWCDSNAACWEGGVGYMFWVRSAWLSRTELDTILWLQSCDRQMEGFSGCTQYLKESWWQMKNSSSCCYYKPLTQATFPPWKLSSGVTSLQPSPSAS